MQEYFIELSKYLIAVCMSVYTLECFLALRIKEEKKKRGVYAVQEILLFAVQLLCFAVIYLKSGDGDYLFFCAFVQLLLVAVIFLARMLYEKINRLLLNNMCMLLGISFVVLSRLSLQKSIRQLVIAAFAMVIGLTVPALMQNIKFLPKLKWLYAAMGLFVLTAVFVLGDITRGSKLSFSIGGITFQPSEFVKILFVLFLAAMLCENTSFKRIVLTSVLAAGHVMILVASKDLGGAVIFFVTYVVFVFMATGNYWYLLIGLAAGSGGAIGAYYLFDHVRIRVLAWQDPFAYIDNQGFQISQSLFAIGSGNWFGLGLFGGAPGDIPQVETDFIFSAICEELGVICGVCIILICVSCFMAMMQIGMRQKDRFYKLTALGIGVMYIFQVFLTIGGGIKFIPLTGVTLPFLSYGGSSVLATVLMFFIVEAISVRKVNAKAEQYGVKVVYSFVLLFLGMIGYLVYFAVTNEQELINNSYNSRQEMLNMQNYRGSIYASGGEALAETKLLADGTEERWYPYGEVFSHVVGFSTQGRTGIEAQANYYLIHSNLPLPEKIANDVAGAKNAGDNVYTTLDAALQEAAFKALDNYRGAIVVSEPSTGRILAMVSTPGFDSNEIADIWEDLVEDKESSVLVNRASQGLYPPGSTFKIVTALEYIRENPDTWQDYSFTCPGYYEEDGNRIRCYHGISHGKVDLTESFAKSCNASFANIGMSLDEAMLQDTLEKLLFNKNLPVSFLSAKSSALYWDEISPADMMQTVIGQGRTQITPLHLNMITAAIANDGIMMKPYLIDHVENANGNLVKTFGASAYGRVMSEEEAQILAGLMTAVVEEGTATRISGLSYTVAGKTGSAEYGNVKGESHAWFTGFAPAENPQICVTIILEGAGSGGDYAVPMAKRVFNAWFNR